MNSLHCNFINIANFATQNVFWIFTPQTSSRNVRFLWSSTSRHLRIIPNQLFDIIYRKSTFGRATWSRFVQQRPAVKSFFKISSGRVLQPATTWTRKRCNRDLYLLNGKEKQWNKVMIHVKYDNNLVMKSKWKFEMRVINMKTDEHRIVCYWLTKKVVGPSDPPCTYAMRLIADR